MIRKVVVAVLFVAIAGFAFGQEEQPRQEKPKPVQTLVLLEGETITLTMHSFARVDKREDAFILLDSEGKLVWVYPSDNVTALVVPSDAIEVSQASNNQPEQQ